MFNREIMFAADWGHAVLQKQGKNSVLLQGWKMWMGFCCHQWSGTKPPLKASLQNHGPSILVALVNLQSWVLSLSVSILHVILLTILTLRAGGRFDSHFWTQSGAPSPYLAFRAPPRFQAIYGVESVPRFQPIFGIRSAPPPAFKLYMVLKACPPAFNPYLALRAPPRFQALYGVESVPCFQPIFGIQSAPRFQAIFCVESGPIFSV